MISFVEIGMGSSNQNQSDQGSRPVVQLVD